LNLLHFVAGRLGRERPNIIRRFRGFAQTVRVPSYGRRDLAKSSYNFYSGWKSL